MRDLDSDGDASLAGEVECLLPLRVSDSDRPLHTVRGSGIEHELDGSRLLGTYLQYAHACRRDQRVADEACGRASRCGEATREGHERRSGRGDYLPHGGAVSE